MAYGRRVGAIVRAAIVALIPIVLPGCGSGGTVPDHIDGPDYQQSPIWMSDMTGTFSFTVGAPQPVQLVADRARALIVPSPDRTRVALTLLSGGAGTEVYDLAGTLLGSFEASLSLVGWAGEDSLVFANQNVAADVVRTNLDGSVRTSFDLGFTADTGFPQVFRATTSRKGKYLAVSFLLDAEVLVVDTATGEIVRTYPVDDTLYPPDLAWLYDDTLVLVNGVGGSAPYIATTTSSMLTKTAFAGSPCSIDSWTPSHPMLLGTAEAFGDIALCSRRSAARENGTGLMPLDWLTDPGSPGSLLPSAVYALSPDARRVVFQSAGAINVASPNGSGATPLLTVQSPLVMLAW